MSGESPRIYLDTNIILDVIERRRNESIFLLEKIKRLKLYCCTSTYTILELINIEQDFTHITNLLGKRYTIDEILRKRRQKRLTQEQREDAIDRVKNFLKQYKIVVLNLLDSGWDLTFEMLRDLNVTVGDAIHVATAKEDECTLFVSNDEELGKEAEKILSWATSKKANDIFATT